MGENPRGKRKLAMGSPRKCCEKKIKRNTIDTFLFPNSLDFSVNSENNRLNQYEFTNSIKKALPVKLPPSDNVKYSPKRNLGRSYAIKDYESSRESDTSFRDGPKTQRSIMQYFSAQ